jgi:hypothetical protein
VIFVVPASLRGVADLCEGLVSFIRFRHAAQLDVGEDPDYGLRLDNALLLPPRLDDLPRELGFAGGTYIRMFWTVCVEEQRVWLSGLQDAELQRS